MVEGSRGTCQSTYMSINVLCVFNTLTWHVLTQQIELEEKITLIQELDAECGNDNDLNTDARKHYYEFTDTLKNWHIENAQLSRP